MKTYKNLFVNAVVMAVAVAGPAMFLASCEADPTADPKDYDAQIEDIVKRVKTLEDAVAAFDQLVADGAVIDQITPLPGNLGFSITFKGGRDPIEIMHGTAAVVPLFEVRENTDGTGWSVWYKVTAGYPESGWVDTEQDLTGPQGVAPQIRVSTAGGKFVIEYNITPGYPDTSWVTTTTDLKAEADPGPIASIVDNGDGTVTINMRSANQQTTVSYTFAKASNIQSIEIMTPGPVEFTGSEDKEIIFRVNPSTATVPTATEYNFNNLARWAIDLVSTREVTTRASYITTTPVFKVKSVLRDGEKTGQYKLTVTSNHTGQTEELLEYITALVFINGGDIPDADTDGLISSGIFSMTVELPAGDKVVASGTTGATGNIAWALKGDGSMTFTGTGEMTDYAGQYGYGDKVPWAGNRAAITSVTVGEGITNVANNAFTNCTNLTTVTLPTTIAKIGEYAFSDCSNLASVTLPSSLQSLGQQAFVRTAITSVALPNSLTTIGTNVFMGCSKLADVTIGTGLTTLTANLFAECALTSVSIPANIKTIANYVFEKNKKMTNITFAEGLESLGTYVFRDCIILENITLPTTLKAIGGNAFSGCVKFTAITIPNNVTTIGGNAFSGCDALASVVIGSSVTDIQYTAFTSPALTNVTILAASAPTLGSSNFSASGDTLTVPQGSLSAYQGNTNWSTAFDNIVEAQ